MIQFEKIASTSKGVLYIASRDRLGSYPPRRVQGSSHLRARPRCRVLFLPGGSWKGCGRREGRLIESVDRLGSSSGRYHRENLGEFYAEWVSFFTPRVLRLVRAIMVNYESIFPFEFNGVSKPTILAISLPVVTSAETPIGGFSMANT